MTRARRLTDRRRGVALILVLWLVVVLGTLALAVTASARRTTGVVANARARVAARHAAESGIVVAVAEIERRLAAFPDSLARRRWLNALDAAGDREPRALGDARFQVALVDASARLDVNTAGADALAALFARVGDATAARAAAEAVQRAIGAGEPPAPGQPPAAGRPLRAVDDLERVPGVPAVLARAAAPYLTVDGDGRTNRVAAPAPVREAARGELVDEPTRLVIVSRGWLDGSALTHEIQAVYAVRGAQLAFVRWRERDL